jgi:hypothetical protein
MQLSLLAEIKPNYSMRSLLTLEDEIQEQNDPAAFCIQVQG